MLPPHKPQPRNKTYKSVHISMLPMLCVKSTRSTIRTRKEQQKTNRVLRAMTIIEAQYVRVRNSKKTNRVLLAITIVEAQYVRVRKSKKQTGTWCISWHFFSIHVKLWSKSTFSNTMYYFCRVSRIMHYMCLWICACEHINMNAIKATVFQQFLKSKQCAWLVN